VGLWGHGKSRILYFFYEKINCEQDFLNDTEEYQKLREYSLVIGRLL
jgi:hypothetical protein